MSKEDLLRELESLGYHRDGRKVRSDKGKERGPNTAIRKVETTPRSTKGIQKDPVAVYAALKGKLLNKETSPTDTYTVIEDINGIFLLMKRENHTVENKYVIVHRGQALNRTVKHIQGYTTDLESYRFRALQSIVSNSGFNEKEERLFKKEIDTYKVNNPLDLFCCLYRVHDYDCLMWSYEKWRKDYDIAAPSLPENIQICFELNKRPGTENFLPWLAEDRALLLLDREIEIYGSREFSMKKASVYREVYAAQFLKAQQAVLSNKQYNLLSKAQIDKEIHKRIKKNYVNSLVDERMREWVKEQMRDD